MERLDDLQVYSKLLRHVEDLRGLADQCHSPAAATAIQTAAALTKAVASGLYQNSIKAMADEGPIFGGKLPKCQSVSGAQSLPE